MTLDHKEHRKRLRQRFAANGFDGFHNYEVLEFILFYIFRQGDTKPLAKHLIEKFGSFSRVLDASISELAEVNGMGIESATALVALRSALTFYFKDHAKQDKTQFTKMSSLIEYLQVMIGGKPNEVLFAIFLNAKNEMLDSKELSEGTVSQASAFPRRIVEEALKLKATSIILAHNHPGGVAEPSDDDILITNEIKKSLALVDVTLQDHIILADDDYYSFKRSDLL